MGKTIQVASDRASDQTKTILPAEVARGVYMRNAPSLQALKLMHLMIATAGGRMAADVQHEIRLSDIRQVEGMRNHDRASLTPLFEELRAAVMTYDDAAAMRVTIGGLLDQAMIDYRHEVSGDTMVSWFFGRMFRDMAERSNHWAVLDRQTVFHLGSKYSVLLFQHIASLIGLAHVQSKTFTVPELRALLGIPAGKIKRFADLNRDVLTPAIAEINQLSRFELIPTARKIGRTVASIEIAWKVKTDPVEAARELAASKVGRKARRAGTVETVAEDAAAASAAFPESGSISFGRWGELARTNLPTPTPDVDMVADKFRARCAATKRSLAGTDIEVYFVNFCKKWRLA